jgi:hypothetical protein
MDWISNESDLWLDAGIALVPADVLPVIPTRGVLDSFNRADTTTAGLGSAWTAIGAQTPRILSNAASTSATAGYDEGWLNTFAATQDVELWGTVKAGSNSTDGMYLSWRLRGPSGTGDPTTNWNGYVFRISSALSQKPMIRRWNGGAWTDVWFGTEAAAAGDTYIIRHVGSRLEVWRRREQMFTAGVWVKICDQLESGYVWQGRIGLGLTPNESGKWEEFGGGSAPTPNWYTVAGGNNLGVDFTSATSVAKTLDGPVAVGDLIVVAMSRSCSSNDVASDTCADSLGNVYTRGGGGFETFDAGGLSWFWSKATVAGWPTVTVTFPNSQPNRIIACQVYRSTAGVAFDVSASLSVNSDLAGSGPDNLTVGPITPTVNGDLIVAGFGQYSNLNPAYSGTMWTEDENSGVATLSYVIVESKVQEVAAALSGVATDQGSAGRYLGFVSAFKPSGGYVPAVPRQTAIVRAMRML